MQEHVKTQTQTANTDTSANPVIKEVTEKKIAQMVVNEMYGLKCFHHNLWDDELILSPTMAEWSETAEPLPHPPLPEILNPTVSKTISNNPHLFKVNTPIKVDIFEVLLKDHPNPLFVKSVCQGL